MKKIALLLIIILVSNSLVYGQPMPSSLKRFLRLLDTPSTYSGQSGKVATVNDAENALEFTAVSGGGTGDLLADGSIPLTGNWDVGNFDIILKALTGDGTIEGATLTEGGNAVYNATETPGGELGGTFASFTIDDSISVSSWNLTTPTITTSLTTSTPKTLVVAELDRLDGLAGIIVTDATAVTDIEGAGLSIGGATLNWSAASTDLTDTADLLYETELDDFSELNTQISDKTLVNEEDAATWDALGTFGLGVTITTGDPFTLGVVRWDNGSDLMDGEQIAADTIDNDSIDWADMTDLDTDGAVVWGNIAEGELANSTVISADIKDDTVDSADYAATSIDYEHLADDVISGAAAVGTFESGDTFLVLEAGVGLREVDYDDLPGAGGGDAWSDAVDSDILPTGNDNTYDLGSEAASFKDGFFDGAITATSPSFTNILHLSRENDTASAGPCINFYRSRDGDPTYDVSNGDLLNVINFWGYHTDSHHRAAMIYAYVDNTPSDGDMPGRLEFYTTADGSDTPTLRMTIDSAGLITANAGAAFKNGATDDGFIQIYEDSDDGAHSTKISVVAQAGDITLTLPPDDGDPGEQLQTDGSGVLTWEAAGGAGATAYDDIADPDAASSITFDDGETVIWSTAEDSAGSFFTIDDSDADLAANTYLMHLLYSVDDDQANADYFKCEDAGGVVLTIQQDGDLASAGTIEGATITEGGNAVYSSGETPSGELGGTYANITIDDGVAVSSWTLTNPYVSGFVYSNTDINLRVDADNNGSHEFSFTNGGGTEVAYLDESGNLQFDGTLTVGAVQWDDGSSKIDGEQIADDTVDNDSIDWGDMTDLATDGAVSWGNIAEGELADSTIVDADIKDDVIQEPALNTTNAAGAGTDNYVLSYNHAGTNMTWVAAGAGDMLKATYDSGVSGGVDILTTVDSTYASDYVLLTGTAVGTAAPKTDGALTYDATSGTLAATEFSGGGGSLTGVDAATGDSATAFFDAGTIEHEYGGLQADVSGYTGLIGITGADTTVEVDLLSELLTAMGDVTAFITDDDMPAAAADPDVDAAGEIGRDTDDHSLRGYDGSNQYLYSAKDKPKQFTITNPDLLTEADNLVVWTNNTAFTFNLTEIQATADTDDATFTLKEVDADGANATTIEAVTISTDGTNLYYTTVAVGDIDHTAIEAGHRLMYDASAFDTDYIHIALEGYFNADVP